MKAIQIIVRTLLSTTLLFAYISMGFCAETTVVVNLHKKIKSNLSAMKANTEETEGKIKQINSEINPLVDKIEAVEDDKKREALTNKYYELRAREIFYWAKWGADTSKYLARIIGDCATLRTEMQRIGQKENDKLQASDATAVKRTLKNLSQIVGTLYALKKDDPQMQYMAMTLTTLDTKYKTFFNENRNISFDLQLAYLEDIHAYVNAVMANLDIHRQHIQYQIFVSMANNIIKILNVNSDDIIKITMPTDNSDRLNSDNRVFNLTSHEVSLNKRRDYDFSKIGKW